MGKQPVNMHSFECFHLSAGGRCSVMGTVCGFVLISAMKFKFKILSQSSDLVGTDTYVLLEFESFTSQMELFIALHFLQELF